MMQINAGYTSKTTVPRTKNPLLLRQFQAGFDGVPGRAAKLEIKPCIAWTCVNSPMPEAEVDMQKVIDVDQKDIEDKEQNSLMT